MARKKKTQVEEENEDELPFMPDDELEEIPEEEELPKPRRLDEGLFKASEWAMQDGDKPDPALFAWWDAQGVMSHAKYESIKKQVFRKKH